MTRSIAIFILFSFTLFSCVNDEKKVTAIFEKKLGVDKAIDIKSYISQGGSMKALLTAPLMVHYHDSGSRMVLPKSLHVDFFDSTLKVESKLDALYASYFETDNKIFIRDSVRVYNIKGDTLICKELWWDQRLEKIYTEKPVQIRTLDMIMFGEGMSAPQNFKTFEIYKVTNSVIRVKDL